MNSRLRNGLLGMALLWGGLLIAFLVGLATQSVHVFAALLVVGLVVHVIARMTLLRR